MNDFFSWINSGTTEQKNKKRTTAYALAIVSVLLVISLIARAAIGIVTSIRSKNASEEPEETVDPYKGYTTTTFAEGQLYSGDLIWTDDTYVYAGSNALELLNDTRPKAEDGKTPLYTILGWTTLSVTHDTAEAFHKMFNDFYAQNANAASDLIVSNAANGSGNANVYGNGLTVELKYYEYWNSNSDNKVSTIANAEAYKWIYENAYKYGFVQLYSAPEAVTEEGAEAAADNTHIFRYVGAVHAQLMKDKNCATLADYLELLETKTTYKTHLRVTIDKVSYEVYYLPADGEMLVPEKYLDSYTVSGNNMDGYIITVCTTTSK